MHDVSGGNHGQMPGLTNEFVEQLQTALDRGAYRAVRTLLEPRDPAELDAVPECWLLLARAVWDEGDFDKALAILDRARKPDQVQSQIDVWAARIAAAKGDRSLVEAVLQRLATTSPPEQLLAVRLLVALSLGDILEVRPLLDEIRKFIGVETAPSTLEIFANNVAALADKDLSLAKRLASSRPWDRLILNEENEINVPYRRAGDGPVPMIDLRTQIPIEEAALTANHPRLQITQPVLVLGTGTGHLIDQLCQVPPQHGKHLALLVIVFDWDQLAALLLYRDWSAQLSSGVIRLLGCDPAELRTYLSEDLRRLPSESVLLHRTLLPASQTSQYLEQAQRIVQEISQGAAERLRQLDDWYASEGFQQRWRTLNDGGPMHIMLQTCRYTTFIYPNSLHIADAFRKHGHKVTVLEEGTDPHHWIGRSYVQDAVSQGRPDVFVRLNFLRQEHDSQLPVGLPFLTWIQDICPAHDTSCSPYRMWPRDYVTGLSRHNLVNAGYAPSHHLPNLVPSSESVYRPRRDEPRVYRYEISYVSHQSKTVQQVLASLKPVLTAEDHRRLQRFAERLLEAKEQGSLVSAILSRTGWVTLLDAETRPLSLTGGLQYMTMLIEPLFRQTILEWISDAGYDLALFGNGWSEHPTLGRHARGSVENGPALAKLIRQSRINLQLTASRACHQRLYDGLQAGGFFLLPRNHSFQPPIPCLDPVRQERLFRTMVESPVACFEDLQQIDPESAEYLREVASDARTAPQFKADMEKLFTHVLSLAVDDVEIRIPQCRDTMFASKEELLTQLQHWLPDDAGREDFVAQIHRAGRLRSFTTEFQTLRLLEWLSQRVGRLDPPMAVPAPVLEPIAAVEKSWIADQTAIGVTHFVDAQQRPLLQVEFVGDWGHAASQQRNDVSSQANLAKPLKVLDGARKPLLQGQLVQGKPHGVWRTWHPNGSLQEEVEYHQGKRHGKGVLWSPNGTKQEEGQWLGGLRHGDWKWWWSGGEVVECYQDGIRHGLRRILARETGTVIGEEPFVQGKRHGRCRYFHLNGQLRREGQYDKDVPIGEWRQWSTNGRLLSVSVMDSTGSRAEVIRLNAAGQKRSRVEQVKGEKDKYRPDGETIQWHRNGQVSSRGRFTNGKLVGELIDYYSDGSVKRRSHWKQGKRHGRYVRFSPSGEVLIDRHYVAGHLVPSE